ncbi:TetR family transcriptional regulator, partial [Streptomyces purpurogeneiscleroticus]|nr:TetR family transcriptional regulator [Streptomyces purpurogeneiscleroticus]
PAHPIITGQKQWMLDLFTRLAGDIAPGRAGPLARTLMLLHEGALVAHGLNIFPDPISHAREQAQALLAGDMG